VVAISIFKKVRVLAAAIAIIAGSTAASPAFANSSANADILAPLRAAQATKQQSGDQEFRQLFAKWQSQDTTGTRTNLVSMATPNRAAAVIPGITSPKVSIPSLITVEGVTTSSYGMRTYPVLGGRRQHKGIDLAAPVGTPIHAPADGIVSRADWFSSYGLYVSLQHGGGIETRFGHMSRLNVAAGQAVHKGDIIGYVGTTGRSTGPHLHYEIRLDGESVNPLPYLQTNVADADSDAG